MFWKKKEKTIETTTIMFQRIKKLYDLMFECNLIKNTCSNMICYGLEPIIFNKYAFCIYRSALGKRSVTIRKKSTDSNPYYVLEFEKFEITKNKEVEIDMVFTLEVFKNETKIQPCPISLTAHEIDLAILEFENYINKIYEEHKAKQEELSA